MTITRSSNQITGLVAGITLDLKGTSASGVTVNVDRDTDVAVEAISSLVSERNSTLTRLGELTAYNSE